MWCRSRSSARERRALLHTAAALALTAATPAVVARVVAGETQGLGPALLPGAAVVGRGTLRFLGLAVYHATLWAAPGWQPAQLGQTPLVLELHYLRSFRGRDIALRSLEEMRRAGPLEPAEEARWLAAMQRLFPDVADGDRIAGLWDPAHGARFVLARAGGAPQPLGELAEPRFAERFFGIWLAPTTSQPALRAALLGLSGPTAAR
ncbi:hypothetical protein Talka_02217 [Tepidimonas alkaliphilus]|uniref:Chalcone isomerase domain-containing protein n=1 Tax=Tepidimonas alkaliphilus TaxID=2588942 RepID=A0A554W460_9BURK|nr:chalcone isomerase family protein [Tepidimonas alkaliphilus]TSE18368.1 hypothetical protein Talka_02217 [Tepidimonas alkaliphilus]